MTDPNTDLVNTLVLVRPHELADLAGQVLRMGDTRDEKSRKDFAAWIALKLDALVDSRQFHFSGFPDVLAPVVKP